MSVAWVQIFSLRFAWCLHGVALATQGGSWLGDFVGKVLVLCFLGAIGYFFYARRARREERNLLKSGFPPDLARKVAELIADQRWDEATQLLRNAKKTPPEKRDE
ncbi:MAG: hypothetical protein B7Z37_28670 [Verrucomicrobia bacterium 12-59-8]|nr:MAG: hypothetical protein B7Z37_28670 [Verrucomicrobia bacterium 12-59-8]